MCVGIFVLMCVSLHTDQLLACQYFQETGGVAFQKARGGRGAVLPARLQAVLPACDTYSEHSCASMVPAHPTSHPFPLPPLPPGGSMLRVGAGGPGRAGAPTTSEPVKSDTLHSQQAPQRNSNSNSNTTILSISPPRWVPL
mmetsp:Transcript_25240/g.63371  ORF Transcript_25240/g.63371 Transcript_25240/m.63371 type:complete len:141 (-) Transcript_25240:156-578(-)